MRSPFDHLPASWKVPATVIRGGGKDRFGYLLPVQEIERPAVLIAKGTSVEDDNASALVSTEMRLFDGDTSFRYEATDRIRIADGLPNAGEWAVSGLPFVWPYGSEVPLERA